MLFGWKYTIDTLRVSFGAKGLDSVRLYDFAVKSSEHINFKISVDEIVGRMEFDADYEPRSWYVGNKTYCPFSNTAWNQPCPHRDYFINATYVLKNFRAQFEVKAVIKACSGWFLVSTT